MSITNPIISELVAMAWDDKASFEAIEKLTGFSEKITIKLMKQHLKSSSYRLWRKRVQGRKSKHEYKSLCLSEYYNANADACNLQELFEKSIMTKADA